MTAPTKPGRSLRRSGGLIWTAALCGIALWMIHITAVSSLVQYACNDKGTLWWLHAATVATAVPTALAMWVCRNLIRQSGDEESAGSLAGNYTFIGVFGFIMGAFSLALILLEGSYVIFLSPCA